LIWHSISRNWWCNTWSNRSAGSYQPAWIVAKNNMPNLHTFLMSELIILTFSPFLT
jgi:hypothetical protein